MNLSQMYDLFKSSVIGDVGLIVVLLTILTFGLPIIYYGLFFNSICKLTNILLHKKHYRLSFIWKIPLILLTYPFVFTSLFLLPGFLDYDSYRFCLQDCNYVTPDNYLPIRKAIGQNLANLYNLLFLIDLLLLLVFIVVMFFKYRTYYAKSKLTQFN